MSRHPMMRWIFVALTCAAVSASADWVTLKNCRLVENSSNDADSFLVECKSGYRGKTYNRFRLYFVDAAETDSNSKFKRERLKDQAAYWGRDDPDFARQMGLYAKQVVKKMLRDGFTVYTRGEFAPTLGMPRPYALIRVNDRWLDEILVEAGLVRIYGKGTTLPNERNDKTHWNHLRLLERTAKAQRRNAWRKFN